MIDRAKRHGVDPQVIPSVAELNDAAIARRVRAVATILPLSGTGGVADDRLQKRQRPEFSRLALPMRPL